MALEEMPQLMEFISYTGDGSYRPNVGHGPPRERARESDDQAIQAGSSAGVGLFRRRSSGLPTLPLDILLEIFSDLHPSDLVSLSRMNKKFRSLLLSHRHSVLWNKCFKLCRAPACPADLSPQAWAHLLFGGAYCYSCGSETENNILLSLRRRACRSCMAAHLVCSSSVPQQFRDMVRFEPGYASIFYQCMPCYSPSCIRHWWNEDVAAFEAELDALIYDVGASDGGIADIWANARAFLARKKEEVKVIGEHALSIYAEWEKDRNLSLFSKSSDVKLFEDFKAQSLQPGYLEGGVGRLHRHREAVMQTNSHWEDQPDLGALLDASPRNGYQPLPIGSRHEDFALRGDGRLIHDHSESIMQASSPQDQVPWLDAPSCRQAGARALEGNDHPDYAYSHFIMSGNSQDHVTQHNASSYQSSNGSAPEGFTSRYSTLTDALSLSSMPTQPQDQPDTPPNEQTPSNPKQCPLCRRPFGRTRERNRHVESYLPHSVYCPLPNCTWTGRRRWDFKEHWKRKHPEDGQAPGEDDTEMYDPKDFVKSIVDGTPLAEVEQSAISVVQEKLLKLGKVERVKVWGRKRKKDY